MRLRILRFASVLLLVTSALGQGSTIVLQRKWMEQYKDRATIEGNMLVDHALSSPKTPSKSNPSNDGDIHAAGRSREVGLPMVAEIMNAKDELGAVKDVDSREADGQAANFTGVWRLWFEHPPSGKTQVQILSKDIAPGANTNPPHSFEVHPLTIFEGYDLHCTFHDIPGYQPKDAKTAFGRYEKLKLSLQSDSQTVSVTSKMIGYNYVRFRLRLDSKPTELPGGDGLEANADIFEVEEADDQEALASGIRLIFVAGTVPAAEITKLAEGDELVVLGIPRLNLNAVSTFLRGGGRSATNRKLQYEMVIVAVEGQQASCSSNQSPVPAGVAKTKAIANKKHKTGKS